MPKKTKGLKPKVTAAQIDVICTFFEENPELITGYKMTPKGIEAVQVKWERITPYLNSLGANKTPKGWAKYLCCQKARLKKKRIKWRQNRDGSGPVICNARDFSEIGLRMLQVFRKDITYRDSLNTNTSNIDSEDNVKAEQNNKLETVVVKLETNKPCDFNDADMNEKTRATPMATQIFLNPNEETPQVFVNSNDVGDDFDMFGRNMAQQLRALPLDIALETQEIMWSVMFKQRLKVMEDIGDPLDKKSS